MAKMLPRCSNLFSGTAALQQSSLDHFIIIISTSDYFFTLRMHLAVDTTISHIT